MEINDFEQVPCPLCGNTELKLISKKGQFGLPCFVSICPNDGLVFLSPRWSKTRYMDFYKNEYDVYYRPNVLEKQTSEIKYKNIKEIFARLEQFDLLRNQESVLDVGSGMGWSLEWIMKNFKQFKKFAAIESSKHCIKNLINVLNIEPLADDVDSSWKSNGFDLIIMRHVLEHLTDPIKSLNKIADNLTEDGILYLAVPNMMKPKGSLRYYWFRVVHTFYFSKETLIKIAEISGLECVKLISENSELWGIFRVKRTNKTNVSLNNNHFLKQMYIIKKYKRKCMLIDLKVITKLYLKINNVKKSII